MCIMSHVNGSDFNLVGWVWPLEMVSPDKTFIKQTQNPVHAVLRLSDPNVDDIMKLNCRET